MVSKFYFLVAVLYDSQNVITSTQLTILFYERKIQWAAVDHPRIIIFF